MIQLLRDISDFTGDWPFADYSAEGDNFARLTMQVR
jgi:hypothetical protein